MQEALGLSKWLKFGSRHKPVAKIMGPTASQWSCNIGIGDPNKGGGIKGEGKA